MSNPFVTGPIAPENNPAIHPDWFAPRLYSIAAISQGINTTITTEEEHDYVVGQTVRTIIPSFYGMRELNGVISNIISIPSATTFVIPIDSLQFNAFIPDPSYGPNLPYVVAIGDVNSGYISSTGRTVPFVGILGSFINISPTIG